MLTLFFHISEIIWGFPSSLDSHPHKHVRAKSNALRLCLIPTSLYCRDWNELYLGYLILPFSQAYYHPLQLESGLSISPCSVILHWLCLLHRRLSQPVRRHHHKKDSLQEEYSYRVNPTPPIRDLHSPLLKTFKTDEQPATTR